MDRDFGHAFIPRIGEENYKAVDRWRYRYDSALSESRSCDPQVGHRLGGGEPCSLCILTIQMPPGTSARAPARC